MERERKEGGRERDREEKDRVGVVYGVSVRTWFNHVKG